MLNQMPELRIDHIIYNNLFLLKERAHKVEPLTDFEKGADKKMKTFVPKWKPEVLNIQLPQRGIGTIHIDSKVGGCLG